MAEPFNTDCERSDRGAGGKFLPGNAAARGHGRPNARRVAELRAALFSVLTPEAIEAIARQLVELAEEGDTAAAKLVLSYAVGDADRVQLYATSSSLLDEL